MNVAFHTLTSLATAAVLASRQKSIDQLTIMIPSDVPLLATGLISGVLVHGLLDYVPHSYPIPSSVDVALSLALFSISLFVVGNRRWLAFSVCFLGSIFPDLVDLGPPLLNNHLGWSLPVVKVFPWHWRQYSGSIYDGSRGAESFLYHLLVFTASAFLLWIYRESLFKKAS